MKTKKISFAALAAAAVLGLASCGGDTLTEYTLEDGTKVMCKDTYNMIYQTETGKDKFNYLCNSWTYNSDQYANMVEGLVENDKYGNIKGAIASDWSNKKNADGTETWTFNLKQGIKWVDNATGEEIADVTAHDFVAGIKYVLTPGNGSATAGVVTTALNGAKDYLTSLSDEDATNDLGFETVGVKAVSDYVLEYTVPTPTPYFPTSLTYSPFLPVRQAFLDSIGTGFGADENSIEVNGPYRMTTHDYQSKIVLTKNDKYWDKEHVYVNQIVETYMASDAALSTPREWYEAGLIDGFTVNANDEAGYAKYVGDDYKSPVDPNCNAVLSLGDATYVGYFNFGRYTWEYDTANKHKKTEGSVEAANAAKAVQNVKVRQGVLYGLDIFRYLRRFGNDDIALQRLTRSYTIPELAICDGKDYTSYVVDVYNEKNGTNLTDLSGVTNGQDPILNQTKAKALLAEAKAELEAAGVTSFPIYLDVIGSMNTTLAAYEKDMYDNFNQTVGAGVIQFNTVTPANDTQNEEWGSQTANYDFSIWSGWGPDYADPATFLHTMIVSGDMVDSLGFIDATTDALEEEMLGAYTDVYEAAAAITDDIDARYKAFAKAEYKLIYEDAIVIPWYTATGYSNTVSNVIPYQVMKATYGLSSSRLKYVMVSAEPISQELRAKIKAAYDAGK